MRYLSDKQFQSKMSKIRMENKQKKKLQALKAERKKYQHKLKLPSTSKLILLGIILLCVEIVIFCEYVMLKLQDTSSMYVLIGIPTSLIPVVLGYYFKSKAENTSGGIVYDMAMSQLDNQPEENNSEDSDESEDTVG